MRMSRKVVASFLAALALSGCGQVQDKIKQMKAEVQGIFSTRPQTGTHTLLLLKLKEKPLLTSVQSREGKKVVAAELAKAVGAEQETVIQSLQSISKNIQILYRYKMVMNALAIVAPNETIEAIKKIASVAYFEPSGSFSRPVVLDDHNSVRANTLSERNSVKFIGAAMAHERGVRGQGMKVGIIDTGIDYTHAMFGGAGTPEAYKAVDPAKENSGFPSAKVVGGTDLVGTTYDSNAADMRQRIPVPDANPLDEGGHGSHVAGTVAGHGDGVNTYDGVAPDASLYAIKVFGKEGSTGDAVVIAALEYAADPDANGEISDQLDVVNLSLGGPYGEGHLLYNEAIGNLSRGGTMVVCSGGNSGDINYIVGAPGVSDEALSVAASVDDMDLNWKFAAVKFLTPEKGDIVVEAVQATVAKPIAEAGDVHGPLVPVGLADTDFSDEVKALLKGKVALIDRGVVTFADKIRRAAEAGAIGVVVANNQAGAPFAMGGSGHYDIPAIMIAKDLGVTLKAELKKGEVSIIFNTNQFIEKPELIDTITGFSSKGPRSNDALIKPEISAPGNQVISAAMGEGNKGVAFSGTSMASPHMAGVIALLKQKRPNLTSAELKSLVMGTAKTIVDEKKQKYPISRQGAGRVQVIPALEAQVVTLPASLSLGELTVETRKVVQKNLELSNITDHEMTLALRLEGDASVKMLNASTVTLAAGKRTSLALRFALDVSALPDTSSEIDGMVIISQASTELARVPVMAIANKVSQVQAGSLMVHSTSTADAQGSIVDLSLKNIGRNSGDVYLFNSLGADGRKNDTTHDPFRSKACDMAQAGYRVIHRDGEAILQVAVKLFEPLTTWDNCEVSVLIDGDGDGTADQELAGISQKHLNGLTAETLSSVLIDAVKARELRKDFEIAGASGKASKEEESYVDAVEGIYSMAAIPHSTVAIVEAPVASLKRKGTDELSIRVATSYIEMSAVEVDDFLERTSTGWSSISLADEGQGYVELPEKVTLAGGETKTVSFTKGATEEDLLVLYPQNKPVIGGLSADLQADVLKPVFDAAILVSGR